MEERKVSQETVDDLKEAFERLKRNREKRPTGMVYLDENGETHVEVTKPELEDVESFLNRAYEREGWEHES